MYVSQSVSCRSGFCVRLRARLGPPGPVRIDGVIPEHRARSVNRAVSSQLSVVLHHDVVACRNISCYIVSFWGGCA